MKWAFNQKRTKTNAEMTEDTTQLPPRSDEMDFPRMQPRTTSLTSTRLKNKKKTLTNAIHTKIEKVIVMLESR